MNMLSVLNGCALTMHWYFATDWRSILVHSILLFSKKFLIMGNKVMKAQFLQKNYFTLNFMGNVLLSPFYILLECPSTPESSS